MLDHLAKKIFNDIQHTLSEQLNSDSGSASQVRATLENSLRKLNLVTREEFDTQQKVLERTREKLEALEIQLAKIEGEKNNTDKV